MRIHELHITERAGGPNFGDAPLTHYLWPKLIDPAITHHHMDAIFYAQGTILRNPMPQPASHRVIFGSGIGYGGVPVIDETWKIYFVRGPRTAQLLGGCRWITDPAMLVKKLVKASTNPSFRTSVMTRWNTELDDAQLADMGVHRIKAQSPADSVINDIAESEILYTETLHGAVVAAALGVPFVMILMDGGHTFKWIDWCSSLDMVWTPISMHEYSLKWAMDHAVPQLVAPSVLRRKEEQLLDQLDKLNTNLRNGVL